MVVAPMLLLVAVIDISQAFIALALFGFLTDACDGLIARSLKNVSERGARLDSRADVCFYTSVLVGLLWLFPARLSEHLYLIGTIVVAYATPIVAGWLKFRRLTSYHTRLARVAAVLLATGLFVWLVWDAMIVLQLGTIVLVFAATEELAITRLLREPRDSIPTVFWLINNHTPGEDRCLQKHPT
jgi:cardiolipin synthase (CMP-forming)